MTEIVTTTLDVRTVIPRERHPLIFNTFRKLGPESRIVAMSFCEPRSCIGRLSS